MPEATSNERATFLRERFIPANLAASRLFREQVPYIGYLISLVGTIVLVDASTRTQTEIVFSVYFIVLAGFFAAEQVRSRRALDRLRRVPGDLDGPQPDPVQTAALPRYLVYARDARDQSMLDAILHSRGRDLEELNAKSRVFRRAFAPYFLSVLFVGIGYLIWVAIFVVGGSPEVEFARAAVVAMAMVPALATGRTRARVTNFQVQENAANAAKAAAVLEAMPNPEPPFRDGTVVRYEDGVYRIEPKAMVPRSDVVGQRTALRRLRFPTTTILCTIFILISVTAFIAHPISGSLVLR